MGATSVFLNPTRLQIFGLTFQLSENKEIQLTDNFFNSLLPFMAYSGNALVSIGELFYDKPGYPRRARSALGVDTVLTLDVCLYVCMFVCLYVCMLVL